MAEINGNDLAQAVTLKEGGAVNLSIAQVKEVIRLVREQLNQYTDEAILWWIRRGQADEG